MANHVSLAPSRVVFRRAAATERRDRSTGARRSSRTPTASEDGTRPRGQCFRTSTTLALSMELCADLSAAVWASIGRSAGQGGDDGFSYCRQRWLRRAGGDSFFPRWRRASFSSRLLVRASLTACQGNTWRSAASVGRTVRSSPLKETPSGLRPPPKIEAPARSCAPSFSQFGHCQFLGGKLAMPTRQEAGGFRGMDEMRYDLLFGHFPSLTHNERISRGPAL